MDVPFNFPYGATDLTREVNRFPNLYGYLNAINLFPAEGVSMRTVEIRFEDGVLVVLAADEPGAAGQTTERETGQSIFLGIPHFPHLETILAKDLQGIIDVNGGVRAPKALDAEVAKRLRTVRGIHAITREYVRLGALKGLIKDGRGRTLYNLFTVFGIAKKTIDFVLGTAGTDVIAKCEEVRDHIQENLKGETMSSIEVLVSGSFFNKLVQHPKVEKYWLNTQNAGQLAKFERERLGGNWGRVFEFQEIMFREYKGSIPVRNGSGAITSEKIIADNMGHAYPVGTTNSFATIDGPTHHIAHVNEPGEEIFISPEPLKHGEGWEFKSQSNPLALCKRPEILVELTTSN